MTLGDVTKANNKSTINRNTGGVGGEEQEKAEGEEIIGEMNTAENEREREKINQNREKVTECATHIFINCIYAYLIPR
jgi:hypothetical protein